MLNTLPTPLQPRRRGGQPFNRNALRTGLHARKHPSPFAAPAPALPALLVDPEIFDQAILALRRQIDSLLQSSQAAAGLRSVLSWHRAILHGIALLNQVVKIRQRCLGPQQHLQYIAAHALELIRYDFCSSGITRDAYSFRANCEKSDLNSPSTPPAEFPDPSGYPHLFLTPRQCQILEPLLPFSPFSKSEEFGEGQGVRSRGRPPAAPLPLLDAAFWKIAHHARWQDLPAGSPPMLTCRRYYSHLYRSGRLFTLYQALYRDLLTFGRSDLPSLVEQGAFSLAGDQIAVQPGRPLSWQVSTALLFLQLACQVSIRILRKGDRSHRSLFPLPPDFPFLPPVP